MDGAKRMQVLINDLLAFSRVGRSGQDIGPVACDAALAGAKANLAAQIGQSRAVIEAGPLPRCWRSCTLMTVVFQNLLGNALKFSSEQPPRIVVTAERDGPFWFFSVADNGIGIEPEYADRVFLIFQRLHDRAAYPGTGIGLAMCRKIVEYFGGRIWLDTVFRSAPGSVSPADAEEARDPKSSRKATMPDSQTTRELMADQDDFKPVDVLLVEDDEGDVLMTREAFEFYKIRNPLHVVTDGEQALQFVRRTGLSPMPAPGTDPARRQPPRRSRVLRTSRRAGTTARWIAGTGGSFGDSRPWRVRREPSASILEVAVRQTGAFFLTLVELPV